MNETLEMPLTWADVIADPTLQNLPYKIELRDGKIVMSPAGKTHARLQAAITSELSLRPNGVTLTEIAIVAAGGVLVADVAWASDARWARYPDDGPLPVAPEICVEIKSPSNSQKEMAMKASAYLAAGAEEVWIVQLDGTRETVGG